MPSTMPDVHRNSIREFPLPGQAALDHSRQLIDRIKTRIRQNGPLTFADYMQMTLYEPGLGYYSAGSRKFGNAGDFVTAPELSPVFSCCLARQVGQVLPDLQSPCILEAGPGSGIMAAGLLQGLQAQGVLPERYFFLETSADLRQRQQEFLRQQAANLFECLHWLEELPDENFNGVIVANEVLDALPVRRVINAGGVWKELYVGLDAEKFSLTIQALDDEMQAIVECRLPAAGQMPDGYTTEINLLAQPWLHSLADVLGKGVILLFDYGYGRNEFYHPQRIEGSLICHYRHLVHHDPFLYPGLQDITASVDFTSIAEAAVAAGLEVSGYTTQAHFLMQSGLDECLQAAYAADSRQEVEASAAVRTLTMPGEMGERIKCMALTRGMNTELCGFRSFDHRHRL